jgi:hypothetical protein
MLSWYPNSTCFSCSPPNINFSKFRYNIALPKLDYISPATAAPTSLKFKIQQIPNTSLAFSRRTSEHCLGTFQSAKFCFDYTPSNTVVSLTTLTPPQLSLSLFPQWDRYVSPKRLLTVNGLYGVMYHKTQLFIVLFCI